MVSFIYDNVYKRNAILGILNALAQFYIFSAQ